VKGGGRFDPGVNRFLKVSIFDSFSVHPIPLTYIESPYTAFTTA
jgi:hypothetical protein